MNNDGNLQVSNNAVTTIDGGIDAVTTQLVLQDISKFPQLTGDEFCILTLIRESDGSIEYVKATALDVGTRTYTIERGFEGTSPLVFQNNDEVRNLLTKEQIDYLDQGKGTAEAISVTDLNNVDNINFDTSLTLSGGGTSEGLVLTDTSLLPTGSTMGIGNSTSPLSSLYTNMLTASGDSSIVGDLTLTGSGNLNINGDITSVSSLDINALSSDISIYSGGDITLGATTNIDATGSKIINLATPTNSGDAATKDYVDGATSGIILDTIDCTNGGANDLTKIEIPFTSAQTNAEYVDIIFEDIGTPTIQTFLIVCTQSTTPNTYLQIEGTSDEGVFFTTDSLGGNGADRWWGSLRIFPKSILKHVKSNYFYARLNTKNYPNNAAGDLFIGDWNGSSVSGTGTLSSYSGWDTGSIGLNGISLWLVNTGNNTFNRGTVKVVKYLPPGG